MTGTLTFIIIPSGTQQQQPPPTRPPITQTIHVKAHFDYDPEEDLYIPCRSVFIGIQEQAENICLGMLLNFFLRRYLLTFIWDVSSSFIPRKRGKNKA